MDDFNREALAIEGNLNLPAQRFIRVLKRLAEIRAMPNKIRRGDNGPEFISIALNYWREEKWIILDLIEPGRPTRNSLVERFSRSFREVVLDAYLLNLPRAVREIVASLINVYRDERLNESRGNVTPPEYRTIHFN